MKKWSKSSIREEAQAHSGDESHANEGRFAKGAATVEEVEKERQSESEGLKRSKQTSTRKIF